jgi:hypothetical protein
MSTVQKSRKSVWNDGGARAHRLDDGIYLAHLLTLERDKLGYTPPGRSAAVMAATLYEIPIRTFRRYFEFSTHATSSKRHILAVARKKAAQTTQ